MPVAPATALILDKHEGIWISYPSLGLVHIVENNVIQTVPWPWAKENRQPRISSVVVDPLSDGFWLGFLDGGVSHFHDGQIDSSIGVKDGLGSNQVWNLQVDSDGTLWAATEGGVSRVKDGRVATMTSKNGLPCDAAHWVVTADDSSLWIYMACGLVRVTRSELNAWELDGKRAIQNIVFDGSDGIRLHASITGYSPLVTKSTDGKLWFVYSDGVSAIDPHHLPLNKLAPPVHVEEITGDNRTYNAPSDVIADVRLPALTRDLEIDYTALSLVAPEQNRFRYKLEGHDRDWQDAGNRRQAFYTDLAPGNYRFRVIACNNSGIWNMQGTTLEFSIAPAYWQTNWFRAACVAAFLVLLWSLYQLRLRQIRQAFNARLEERVGERTRIARDLHDTLLQSFQGLLLRFQTAYELYQTRPADGKRSSRARLIRQRRRSPRDGRPCRGCAPRRSSAMTWPGPSRLSQRRSRRKQVSILQSNCRWGWKAHRETCTRSCGMRSIGLRVRRCAMRSDMPKRSRLKSSFAMMNGSFDCGSGMMARVSTRSF